MEGALITRIFEEEDRSLDLEDKPRLPPEVPLGTKADRAAKHNSQGGNLSVKNEQDPSKTHVVMPKKKEPKVARSKKAALELEQRDSAMEVDYRPVKFVE